METVLHNIAACVGGSNESLFLYGDFNFRLDFSAVVKVGFGSVRDVCIG